MDESLLDDDERCARFGLSQVAGLGPQRLRRLLQEFGSAKAILSSSAQRLQSIEGIGSTLAQAIVSWRDQEAAREQLLRLKEGGVRLIFDGEPDYPRPLREIPEPPFWLMVRGELLPSDRIAVAIVGSRSCTEYGRRCAARIAGGLAQRGVVIVSGLARGIDAAAHRATLAAKGRTIAVLASGLANIYPPEHQQLADEVAGQGALLSEAPLNGEPIGGLFPRRNRIISGLSLGVVVIEAAARSGALSTARHALDQGRDVFAVPGRLGDPSSEGTNRLIKEGACLVTSAEDILEQLGPVELQPAGSASSEQAVAAPPPNLSELERKLWDALSVEPIELDLLLERHGLRASEASAALFMMEMRKLVRRHPGNRYTRALEC